MLLLNVYMYSHKHLHDCAATDVTQARPNMCTLKRHNGTHHL